MQYCDILTGLNIKTVNCHTDHSVSLSSANTSTLSTQINHQISSIERRATNKDGFVLLVGSRIVDTLLKYFPVQYQVSC